MLKENIRNLYELFGNGENTENFVLLYFHSSHAVFVYRHFSFMLWNDFLSDDINYNMLVV